METNSVKQEAVDAILKLPDDTNMEEIMYRLYVLENIQQGRKDAEQNKVKSVDEVLRELQSW